MPPKSIFCNVHSHRKPGREPEFVCRNAFHVLTEQGIRKLGYPVSVGMHPWHANRFSAELIPHLMKLAALPNVLAIGEAGLDRRNGPALSVQLPCWEAQFRLAQELGLPLIVHGVRTWQELLPFLRTSQTNILLHDFRGNTTILQTLLPYPQIYFSFGKSLLTTTTTATVFQQVPAGKLLLETDNSSHTIRQIYAKASELGKEKGEELSIQLKKNTLAFFGAKALAFF